LVVRWNLNLETSQIHVENVRLGFYDALSSSITCHLELTF